MRRAIGAALGGLLFLAACSGPPVGGVKAAVATPTATSTPTTSTPTTTVGTRARADAYLAMVQANQATIKEAWAEANACADEYCAAAKLSAVQLLYEHFDEQLGEAAVPACLAETHDDLLAGVQAASAAVKQMVWALYTRDEAVLIDGAAKLGQAQQAIDAADAHMKALDIESC